MESARLGYRQKRTLSKRVLRAVSTTASIAIDKNILNCTQYIFDDVSYHYCAGCGTLPMYSRPLAACELRIALAFVLCFSQDRNVTYDNPHSLTKTLSVPPFDRIGFGYQSGGTSHDSDDGLVWGSAWQGLRDGFCKK